MMTFRIVALCTIGLIVSATILFLGVSEYHWFETKPVLPDEYELLCTVSNGEKKYSLYNKTLKLHHDMVWDDEWRAIRVAIGLADDSPKPKKIDKYQWTPCETKANLPKVESDNTEDRNTISTARKSVIANQDYAPKVLNVGDEVVVITQEDVESMSAEELRNIDVLLNIVTPTKMCSGDSVFVTDLMYNQGGLIGDTLGKISFVTEDRNMTSTARKSVIANPNYAPKALVDASPIDFLAPMPEYSISFNVGDEVVVITQEDVESMSAEELRNFGILLNIVTSMNICSGKIIKTCGEKLLPRFFK